MEHIKHRLKQVGGGCDTDSTGFGEVRCETFQLACLYDFNA